MTALSMMIGASGAGKTKATAGGSTGKCRRCGRPTTGPDTCDHPDCAGLGLPAMEHDAGLHDPLPGWHDINLETRR